MDKHPGVAGERELRQITDDGLEQAERECGGPPLGLTPEPFEPPGRLLRYVAEWRTGGDQEAGKQTYEDLKRRVDWSGREVVTRLAAFDEQRRNLLDRDRLDGSLRCRPTLGGLQLHARSRDRETGFSEQHATRRALSPELPMTRRGCRRDALSRAPIWQHRGRRSRADDPTRPPRRGPHAATRCCPGSGWKTVSSHAKCPTGPPGRAA